MGEKGGRMSPGGVGACTMRWEVPDGCTLCFSPIFQTKVTAIGGKPVGDQYLPNYLSISSWYSPSKCHLQLQMLDKPFLVRPTMMGQNTGPRLCPAHRGRGALVVS